MKHPSHLITLTGLGWIAGWVWQQRRSGQAVMNSALGYPFFASSLIMLFFSLSSCKGLSNGSIHVRWWWCANIAWGDGKINSAAWVAALFSLTLPTLCATA